jgi:hypothetical protein
VQKQRLQSEGEEKQRGKQKKQELWDFDLKLAVRLEKGLEKERQKKTWRGFFNQVLCFPLISFSIYFESKT